MRPYLTTRVRARGTRIAAPRRALRASAPVKEIPLLLSLAIAVSGCAELVSATASDVAGIAGGAAAGAVTGSPAAAAAAVLGAQSGARAGVNYAQRRIHTEAQDRIAAAAGELKIGQVAVWNTRDRMLEREQRGRVTVSRLISSGGMQCKEIIFSVDSTVDGTAHSAFYITAICRDGTKWKWASAEPATERWGALQ